MRRGAISLSVAALAAGISACGGSSPRPQSAASGAAPGPATTGASPTAPAASTRLLVTLETHRLPAPVQGEAAVATGGPVLAIGGLDSADTSTDRVVALDPSSGASATQGQLAEPLHDASAAELGGRVLVFGGGSASELDTVEELSPPTARIVAHLPGTRSDLSAIAVGSTAYLLGGYDGVAPTPVVLGTGDGAHFTTAARLPVAFRYAAVGAIGSRIYTFGGSTANGGDSSAIQLLDTASGRASVVGHLPRAISHASAVVLGGRIYVLGGRAEGTALRQIVSFDPATGHARSAGELPMAVTNAAAATAGGKGFLIGGLGSTGQTLDSVVELRLG
jgi:Kelch motif